MSIQLQIGYAPKGNGVNPEVWQALTGIAYHEARFPTTRHYTFMVEFEYILSHINALPAPPPSACSLDVGSAPARTPIIPGVVIRDNRYAPGVK